MTKKEKSFMALARSWITKNKLHGPHAFLKYVMLVFVEQLNRSSSDFVFKGGNLLWVYFGSAHTIVDDLTKLAPDKWQGRTNTPPNETTYQTIFAYPDQANGPAWSGINQLFELAH